VIHVLIAMTVKENEYPELLADFRRLVNMDAQKLEEWLQTPESQNTGMKREGEGEAVGHASGRHIVEILQKSEDDYTEEDYEHMQYVRSYITRHIKQRPDKSEEELGHMKWTYSLKNWGHDPLKHEQ